MAEGILTLEGMFLSSLLISITINLRLFRMLAVKLFDVDMSV